MFEGCCRKRVVGHEDARSRNEYARYDAEGERKAYADVRRNGNQKV